MKILFVFFIIIFVFNVNLRAQLIIKVDTLSIKLHDTKDSVILKANKKDLISYAINGNDTFGIWTPGLISIYSFKTGFLQNIYLKNKVFKANLMSFDRIDKIVLLGNFGTALIVGIKSKTEELVELKDLDTYYSLTGMPIKSIERIHKSAAFPPIWTPSGVDYFKLQYSAWMDDFGNIFIGTDHLIYKYRNMQGEYSSVLTYSALNEDVKLTSWSSCTYKRILYADFRANFFIYETSPGLTLENLKTNSVIRLHDFNGFKYRDTKDGRFFTYGRGGYIYYLNQITPGGRIDILRFDVGSYKSDSTQTK